MDNKSRMNREVHVRFCERLGGGSQGLLDRHKGLKRFYSTGSTAGIQPDHAKKLRMQLAALDTATSVEDMDIPGFRLHPLKGKDKGRWSIR